MSRVNSDLKLENKDEQLKKSRHIAMTFSREKFWDALNFVVVEISPQFLMIHTDEQNGNHIYIYLIDRNSWKICRNLRGHGSRDGELQAKIIRDYAITATNMGKLKIWEPSSYKACLQTFNISLDTKENYETKINNLLLVKNTLYITFKHYDISFKFHRENEILDYYSTFKMRIDKFPPERKTPWDYLFTDPTLSLENMATDINLKGILQQIIKAYYEGESFHLSLQAAPDAELDNFINSIICASDYL
jgi:hypothetical protein